MREYFIVWIEAHFLRMQLQMVCLRSLDDSEIVPAARLNLAKRAQVLLPEVTWSVIPAWDKAMLLLGKSQGTEWDEVNGNS
jgi:hypothetical protein